MLTRYFILWCACVHLFTLTSNRAGASHFSDNATPQAMSSNTSHVSNNTGEADLRLGSNSQGYVAGDKSVQKESFQDDNAAARCGSVACVCHNGGTCDENSEVVIDDCYVTRCICAHPYTGEHCELEIDPCLDNPCPADHVCIGLIEQRYSHTSYNCVCAEGYTSTEGNCIDINECDYGSSCGQSCVNTEGSFNCLCSHNLQLQTDGATCEYGHSLNMECSNICQSGSNLWSQCEASCLCQIGWKGSNCDLDIDECNTMPNACRENYACHNERGRYRCDCIDGETWNYIDQLCEECKAWMFGKNCSDVCTCNTITTQSCSKSDGRCTCKVGWTGHDCSTHVECDPWTFGVACEHTCSCNQKRSSSCDRVQGTCSCLEGWTGRDCSTSADLCSTSLCPPHSECQTKAGTHFCKCYNGYEMDESNSKCYELVPVELKITLNYNATGIDLSNSNSSEYRLLAEKVENEMSTKLSVLMAVEIHVTVKSLRSGSLIVDSEVAVPKEIVKDHEKAVALGTSKIMDDGGIQLGVLNVTIKAAVLAGYKFLEDDTKCQRKKQLDDCKENMYCEDEGTEAVCKPVKQDTNDSNKELMLELGLGICVSILCIVFVAWSCYCKRNRCKDTTTKNKEVNNRMQDVSVQNQFRTMIQRVNLNGRRPSLPENASDGVSYFSLELETPGENDQRCFRTEQSGSLYNCVNSEY